MYSSILGGITTDPAMMHIPLDDHMVHRGHGVFDTALIIDGYEVFFVVLQIFTPLNSFVVVQYAQINIFIFDDFCRYLNVLCHVES